MSNIRGVNGQVLGKYRLAAMTGLTTGIAANGSIFQARFAPTAQVRALITDFRMKAAITVPFTAANEITAMAFLLRGYTANGSGGTSILPTGIQNMLASISDAALPSAFTDIRIAGTGALTAGTATLDPSAFLVLPASQPLAAASGAQNGAFETALGAYTDQRWPVNLQGQTGGVAGNAEGIQVQLPVAQGAAGVVRYVIEMEWIEYSTQFSAAPYGP